MKKHYIKLLVIINVLLLALACKNFQSSNKNVIQTADNKGQITELNLNKTPIPPPIPTLLNVVNTPDMTDTNDVAIEVDGEYVSRKKFNTGYQKFLIDNSLMDSDETKQKYIDKVSNDLMFLYYARENKISETTEFQNEFKDLLDNFIIEYVKRKIIHGNVQVNYSEIEQYYKEHIKDYSEPEKIQVRHILTNTEEEAQKAMERLRNGEDFKKVASEVSIHASKHKGGELPSFSRGSYNSTFEEAAFKLKIGELSPIIKAETGYHIIEKTGEYPAQNIPLENLKGEISKILLEKKEKEAVTHFIEEIKKQVTIRIYPESNQTK